MVTNFETIKWMNLFSVAYTFVNELDGVFIAINNKCFDTKSDAIHENVKWLKSTGWTKNKEDEV